MGEVRFDRVRKAFGSMVAVAGLDLAIRAGEFVSLLGPSGCGKTTTLRMLAGLEQPSGGRISIAGRVVNDVPPGRRDIAMVFQSYALYPHMSVAQNIEYPLRKRGLPKVEREAKVKEAAALLQLDGLLDRRPRQLSGGQQQRVALGRALVRDPAVFLLDEPLSNLDAKLRAHMRAELILLRRRIGRTMVYVTHDQLEAMTMSDRIAVLHGGVLQQFATPDEVYHRPANPFVAGFIGTPAMNLLAGTLARSADGLAFRSGALDIALPATLCRSDAVRSGPVEAVLGIRPEHLAPAAEGLPAAARVIEPAGHESIVLFDAGGQTLVGRVGPDLRLAVGEPVRLKLRTERLHLFARADGSRLNDDQGTGAPARQMETIR